MSENDVKKARKWLIQQRARAVSEFDTVRHGMSKW